MPRFLYILLCTLLLQANLFANIRVTGIVSDSDNIPVSDACISFIDEASTLIVATDSTDVNGQYEVFLEMNSGVDASEILAPTEFRLFQNYPNPFNPSTIIHYTLKAPTRVRLDIFNILGKKIITLVDRYQTTLRGLARWDGTDEKGNGVPAGLYLYVLSSGSQKLAGKMLLLDGHYEAPIDWDNDEMHATPFPKAMEQVYSIQITGADIETFEASGYEIMEDAWLDFEVKRLKGHYVVKPAPPQGSSSTFIYTEILFTAVETHCSEGHFVEYLYDWGDGSFSDWGKGAETHLFTTAGVYEVRIRARCIPDPAIISEWSAPLVVTVQDVQHTISRPNPPSGPESGDLGTELTYVVSGAVSNLGFAVEYQIDWGDASGWTVFFSNPNTRSHTFQASGTFQIRTRARAIENETIVSEWSDSRQVVISPGEHVVTRPYRPTAPSQAEIYEKVISGGYGASCSHGHSVTYQFDWGDGSDYSEWAQTRHHYYHTPGTYSIKVRARCTVDTTVVSEWSGGRTILIVDALGQIRVFNHLFEPVQIFEIKNEASTYMGRIQASNGSDTPSLLFDISGGERKLLIQSEVTFGLSKLYTIEVIPYEIQELNLFSW